MDVLYPNTEIAPQNPTVDLKYVYEGVCTRARPVLMMRAHVCTY